MAIYINMYGSLGNLLDSRLVPVPEGTEDDELAALIQVEMRAFLDNVTLAPGDTIKIEETV